METNQVNQLTEKINALTVSVERIAGNSNENQFVNNHKEMRRPNFRRSFERNNSWQRHNKQKYNTYKFHGNNNFKGRGSFHKN